MTHCDGWWSPDPLKERADLGVEPRGQNIQLQTVAATWRLETRSYVDWRQRFRLLGHYFGLEPTG